MYEECINVCWLSAENAHLKYLNTLDTTKLLSITRLTPLCSGKDPDAQTAIADILGHVESSQKTGQIKYLCSKRQGNILTTWVSKTVSINEPLEEYTAFFRRNACTHCLQIDHADMEELFNIKANVEHLLDIHPNRDNG